MEVQVLSGKDVPVTVQASGGLIQKQEGWFCHQLHANAESLSLTPRQSFSIQGAHAGA